MAPDDAGRSAHARLAHVADEELARRAARDDRTALDVLLQRHQRRVYLICRRMCADDADALDATQEALITLARRIDRFDGRSSFTTWLYRVTTNACLDELRRRRRRPVPAGADGPLGEADGDGAGRWSTGGRSTVPHPVDPAVDPAERVAVRLDLDRALAQLTPAARAVVVLRDVAGLDYAEIADTLDVPVGTVKSRLARARAQLLDLLNGPSVDTAGRTEGNQPGSGRRPSSDGPVPSSPSTIDVPTRSPGRATGAQDEPSR